jgi:hypothetical protein
MATATLLRELYEGESRRAVRFRYGLLLFDVLTIIFLVVKRPSRFLLEMGVFKEAA